MVKNSEDLQNEYTEQQDLEGRQKRINYLKARRDLRKYQIQVSRIKMLIKLALIMLLSWSLFSVVQLPQWYLTSNIFTVYPNKSLIIEGNDIVKTTQLMSVLKDIKLPQNPLYLINTKEINTSLEKLTPIKKVYVRRLWFPARLKIIIEEKEPLLAISQKPGVSPIALFTTDASIVEREYLPLSNPDDAFSLFTYDDFYKWTTKHINYLSYLLNSIELYSNEKILYFDMRNSKDIYVKLESVNVRLGEINSSIFKRIQRISSILPRTVNLKKDIEYIDLRWDNSTFIKLKNKSAKTRINLN